MNQQEGKWEGWLGGGMKILVESLGTREAVEEMEGSKLQAISEVVSAGLTSWRGCGGWGKEKSEAES